MSDPNESAYPVPAYTDIRGDLREPMYGLTKREYFAGLAMQGYIARDRKLPDPEVCADMALLYADALLAALSAPKDRP